MTNEIKELEEAIKILTRPAALDFTSVEGLVCIQAAQAHLDQLKNGGWRDISTAPKGVYILTYRVGNKSKNAIWSDRAEVSVIHEGWTSFSGWPSYYQPTHWMPLPAAPEENDDE